MTDFENAKVLVKEGWLQGYTQGNLKIFKGVPYAAPPIGERRFKKPFPAGHWRGVRKAVAYSAAAIQYVMPEPEGETADSLPIIQARSQYEEDCLYLNIWSPAKTAEDKLPVFIWIHGGGLFAGSGVECVCDGDGFAKRKDVIVVTINYRLNVFGFFAHPDLSKEGGGCSGNYGLHDMRMACQWVKDNIAAFGGDPERITIAGQSGGGAAVSTILTSPLMNGLAKRVSIESGNVYWGFMYPFPLSEMEERGVKFMERVGAKSIEELRAMDAWEIFDAYHEIPYPNGFSFCVDGDFIPEPFIEMMDAGRINDFDVLIGSCSQEFPAVGKDGISVEDYEKYLEEAFPEVADDMKRWYPAATRDEAAKMCATISSDIMLVGSIKMAQLCHQYGRNAYVWLMNKENETERGHREGSPHCAEMPYVFGRVDKGEANPFFDYHWVGADYDFMELIQGYWYQFAAKGDPNGDGRPEWRPYEKEFDICLLGNDTHMLTEEEQKRYIYYWEKLHEKRPTSTYYMGRLGRV